MNPETELRHRPPETLSRARAIAHKAVQLLTRAARANLSAKPDDSHSNLGWDGERKRFLSQPLAGGDGDYFVGLSLSPMMLGLVRGDQPIAGLDLENTSEGDAVAWLDQQLERAGLKAASTVKLPYELPPDVAEITTFHPEAEAQALSTLSAWFDLAHSLLSKFAVGNANLTPGPGPVRCWPHHFDIATYAALEAGDFETARGIGVGMSPGDETYDQPYFYINPWPHPNPDELPELSAPGHWHTQGFVGAIATADEVLSLSDIAGMLPAFVDGAFAAGRQKLGM